MPRFFPGTAVALRADHNSIAAALEAEFSVEERALLSRPLTASPEAYALYFFVGRVRASPLQPAMDH